MEPKGKQEHPEEALDLSSWHVRKPEETIDSFFSLSSNSLNSPMTKQRMLYLVFFYDDYKDDFCCADDNYM